MLNILVVEDDIAIRDMIRDMLEVADFSVEVATDVPKAQALLQSRRPDLILLDWMLPGQSGLEWAKRLRKDDEYANLPIIMLTARTEEDDKIKSFDTGVDDHISKPFSSRELIARIRAVLRRSGKVDLKTRIDIGGVSLITEQHRVLIGDVPINISPTEYRLMEFFLTHPDRVYSRTQLLDQVWGRHNFIEERTVDVHIRRLRKVLTEFGRENMIQTVRGFGYRFSGPA